MFAAFTGVLEIGLTGVPRNIHGLAASHIDSLCPVFRPLFYFANEETEQKT